MLLEVYIAIKTFNELGFALSNKSCKCTIRSEISVYNIIVASTSQLSSQVNDGMFTTNNQGSNCFEKSRSKYAKQLCSESYRK